MSALRIEVRIPERDALSPRGVALVAAGSLIAGLAIAWWGTDTDAARDRSASATETASPNRNPEPDPSARPDPDSSPDPDPNPTANPDPNANPNPNADPNATASPNENPNANPDPSPSDHGTPSRSGGALPRRETLRVRRGRVAYIRCDGLRRCPRDQALEAAVWPIIDALAACRDAPSAPGEADIRLDYRGGSAPEIAWRDTFPSDTVRLDRERVLGCLAAPLAETRQSVGAARLLVSFRFALVAPP